MNAIPGDRETSFSVVWYRICSAEKLPSMMNVRISSLLSMQYVIQRVGDKVRTYEEYFSFQSDGRLRPGWGHAGQNIAMDPSSGIALSIWWPTPHFIRFWRSRHWREARNSCLYRFYKADLDCIIWAYIGHTGTLSGNMLLVMLCSLEKYCCAVVLHSRLSTRKLSRTRKENTVSICLNVAGKRHDLRSCSWAGFLSEQAQKRTSISKIPPESTTISSTFPDLPVRALRASEYPESRESSKRS